MKNSKEKEEKEKKTLKNNKDITKENDLNNKECENANNLEKNTAIEVEADEEDNLNKNEDEQINRKDDKNQTDDDEVEDNSNQAEGEFDIVGLLNNLAKSEETIQRLEAEKEAANNRLERLQADFSNYRERSKKEMGRVHSKTVVEVIGELLPVLDNFERALEQGDPSDDFHKGVEMIYRQIMIFLEKNGVEVIESVGNEFDHNFHNAVMQVESEKYGSGIIVEELQKGYILEKIVIRPSMVKVAE